jgi:UDP-N-acetylmuramyl pentapeptide phosphotransferase/UDP-N-acetylglucosamine-1-phosphate transferase
MKESILFPRAPDQHKPNKPLVPNGLGVLYVMISAVYIFLLYFFGVKNVANGISAPLTLAACILFGGFMGLLDDWTDLKWRYKAFLPLIAAIPLVTFASKVGARTSIALPLLGTIHFGPVYYFIIIPVLVTIITNTINQLGGLNGLETICPAIIMIGLMAISGSFAILLLCPLIVWLILGYFNFQGKIFVGNTGSFAIGITLAAFAVISDLKFDLVISVLPYIFNSAIILLTFFFYKTKANVSFDGKRLTSNHRRSLITLISFNRPLTEKQIVIIISLLTAATTFAALLARLMSNL